MPAENTQVQAGGRQERQWASKEMSGDLNARTVSQYACIMPLPTQIMGILNVTPDSFSDGGQFVDAAAALAAAQAMVAAGAEIIDVGGESTAPGSVEVSAEEEWRRIGAVVRQLANESISVSVDTWKATIAEQAIAAGASMINDVTGLRGDPRMWDVVEQSTVPVVAMYSKDASPRTTLEERVYADPIATITAFFRQLLRTAEANGIDPCRFILDPGMGAFLSADPQVSYTVLRRLPELKDEFPQNKILIGTSRKGFLRTVSDAAEPSGRLIASVVSALHAARNGADILRVHDVPQTAEALRTESAIADA